MRPPRSRLARCMGRLAERVPPSTNANARKVKSEYAVKPPGWIPGDASKPKRQVDPVGRSIGGKAQASGAMPDMNVGRLSSASETRTTRGPPKAKWAERVGCRRRALSVEPALSHMPSATGAYVAHARIVLETSVDEGINRRQV